MSDDVETTAFVLRLKRGHEAEYKRRHDQIWPEMKEALLGQGILHYEIYLEEGSGLLFAYMQRRKGAPREMEPHRIRFRHDVSHLQLLVTPLSGVLKVRLRVLITDTRSAT